MATTKKTPAVKPKKAAPVAADSVLTPSSRVATPLRHQLVKPPASLGKARQERLAALLTTDDFKKRRSDIVPNDFIEPQFPTGYIVLDHGLGFEGGIHHHGRHVMLQGPEHTGKTTLGVSIAAAFQEFYDEPVWFWDYERTLNPKYAYACGLNRSPRMTFFNQPRNVRQSVRDTMTMLEQDACRCFIFDSISMMYPDIDMDEYFKGKREVDQKTVGEHARFMMDFFRLITPLAARKNALLIFVNQQSTKIATNAQDQRKVKFAGTVTNLDYDLKGGKAPKQFASYQIETSKGAAIVGAKDEKDAFLYESEDFSLGAGTSRGILRNHVRVLKNKATGGGYREMDIYLRAGGGIDDLISVRELAHHYGLIKYVAAGANKGYRIGSEASPILQGVTKAQAIKALVLEQDMNILTPLREEVIRAMQQDDEGFRFKPTLLDKIAAGVEDEDTLLLGLPGMGEGDSLIEDIPMVED